MIASIALPVYRAALAQFTGDTNRFAMRVLVGGALGNIAFGGAFSAFIWEIGTPAPDRGLFTVYMFGLGAGLGFEGTAGGILPTGVTEFETSGRRRIEDFEGFGNITAVEIGGVIFVVGYGGMILADGTPIGPGRSTSPGIGVGPGFFIVLAYWRLELKAPFTP